MRNPLHIPLTSFTLSESKATEGPALHGGHSHTSRPCYVVLHDDRTRIGMLTGAPRSEASRVPASAPAFPNHSLAPSRREGPLVTRHCTLDRYTCRTKKAVSPFASSKLPNLIDTLSHPFRMREGRANIVSRRISPGTRPCNIVLHAGSGASLSAHLVPSLLLRHVTCCYVPAPASRISRHVCREIFRVTPIPSTKPPKSLGTFSNFRSGCSSRAEHRERGTWHRRMCTSRFYRI